MNPEDRLSDALHSVIGTAQPSPDLADRIAVRVSAAGGRRRFGSDARLGLAAIGVIAIVALAIGAPFALNGMNGAGSHATVLYSPVPTPAPTGFAHFDRDGLAFDYPAAWTATASGLNMHYVTILDFVGTGLGTAKCETKTPGPSDNFTSETECGAELAVKPGQVVVELLRSDGPPRPGPIDPADASALGIGQRYVTVGGLPAIFEEKNPADGLTASTLDWTLSMPGQVISRYGLHVEMMGPGLDKMRAQVEALVASLRFDPPVAVLKTADEAHIAAVGLAQAVSNDPALACFPKVPGTSATATVTALPGLSALHKPLPVTCETKIEPTPIGLWKMTLTESWATASDRSAGSYATTVWLEPDGTQGSTGQYGPGPSEIPYWP